MVIGALAFLGLALLPGYYSFDELQWIARGQDAVLPWQDWLNLSVPQYRPLTFDLWLALASLLGGEPLHWHALWAGFAAINGWLLYHVGRSFGLQKGTARWLGLAFLLSPYAVFVHAWVATLADLLVFQFAAVAVLWLRHPWTGSSARWLDDVMVVTLLTLLALASKESAITLPLVLLGAACRHPHPRRACFGALVASLWVGLYLVVRAHTILDTVDVNGSYGWSIANIPANALRYVLFVFDLPRFEVHTELLRWRSWHVVAGGAALLMLTTAFKRGWRWGIALLVAIVLPGPVLILDTIANQYAYLASAAVCVLLALVAVDGGRNTRRIVLALALLAAIHGVWLGVRMARVGEVQQNLYADVLGRLAAGAVTPLRIASVREGDRWLPQRLLHQVPSYRGVALAGVVVVTANAEDADYLMRHDGHLQAPDQPARLK
ncbi:MAG TPA: hypothetical protein VFN09_03180 [Rhodanobacteraceae bacterium]|nr:hypothetical protein [Rhodanobacteraceae bacterium]